MFVGGWSCFSSMRPCSLLMRPCSPSMRECFWCVPVAGHHLARMAP
jgi:hypothetical protein